MNLSSLNQKDRFSFVQGPICTHRITKILKAHQRELQTGAHSLFLGQVRKDKINGKEVVAIEYTAYEDMVLKIFDRIKHHIYDVYNINGLYVLHSMGIVRCGEVSLVVMMTAEHRRGAMDACREAVDLIKSELPIWGKELFGDGDHIWKKNT